MIAAFSLRNTQYAKAMFLEETWFLRLFFQQLFRLLGLLAALIGVEDALADAI